MNAFRKTAAIAVTAAQMAMLAIAPVFVLPPAPAMAATCAASPGKDGAGGTLGGGVNTYYYPSSALTISAGSTSIDLSKFTMDTTSGGGSTAIAANDLILIIQMQDGSFTYTNNSNYGTGMSAGNAGLYEYAAVTAVNGTVLTVQSSGAGNGLLNSYTQAAASGTSGRKSFQIVRVPQYTTATLSNNFAAAYWDGNSGGVAAIDMASTLNLGGASIYATGDGFRGAGVSIASTTPASVLNNDYVDSSQMNGAGNPPGFGGKGEGILGTPDYLFYYTSFTTPSTPAGATVTHGTADGYPGGDQGKGAPGNAGGGGTDQDPAANDQNTGGGGGGNGGTGGNGGYPWTPQYSGNTSLYLPVGVHGASGQTYSASNNGDNGGRGGATMPQAVGRAIMGGGGGAGANNNGSNNNSYNAYGSSGGTGGGIVLMRLADVSGTAATIYANGTTGLAPANDGGGGGGAGGTVIITSPSAFTGITVYSQGAAGTTANAAGAYPGQQHGPGGGGGGGVVISSSSVSANVTGGVAGTTTPSVVDYGATAGTGGYSSIVSYNTVPGVSSGAECYTGVAQSTLLTGPVGAYNTTGSFDGVVTANDNNDFTAAGFIPAGATLSNSSTDPTNPNGNTIAQGPTTVNVENDFDENNSGNNKAVNVTLTGIAPSAPSGWTVQICADNAGTPNCTAGGKWSSIGAAGSTSQSVYSVSKFSNSLVHYWAVYSAPTGIQAYNRYDAGISATDANGNTNGTHNELYPGFVPLTKNVTVQNTHCAGTLILGPDQACPGDILLFSIDYRNIVKGASSESTLSNAWPVTAAGSLVITEPGAGVGASNNWTTRTNGLKEVLVAGANGTTTFGDSTASSVFTGDSVGSLAFTDQPGGPSFKLVPAGISGANEGSQGTLWFRVVVK